MSEKAVASMCDDERRLLQECRGMSDDERKAFSSKGVYLMSSVECKAFS
jgi:biotin carboxylase